MADILKAGDVLDIAFDAGCDRPRIATNEEWDGSPVYVLTFGPPAYRTTVQLYPSWTHERAKLILAEAVEHQRNPSPAPGRPVIAPEMVPPMPEAAPKKRGRPPKNATA